MGGDGVDDGMRKLAGVLENLVGRHPLGNVGAEADVAEIGSLRGDTGMGVCPHPAPFAVGTADAGFGPKRLALA